MTLDPAWPGVFAMDSAPPVPHTAEIVLDEDVSLMMAMAQGNEAAFTQLVRKWQSPVINFFYRSTGSRETAEDLAQVLFIRLFRAAARYTPTARFSSYLFSIARRLLINEYRRARRKPETVIDPGDFATVRSDSEDSGRLSEIEEAFQHALQSLPENHRAAILLLQQQDLSYEEIADALGTTESSVKTWIFRARQKLKHLLKDHLQS